MAVILMISHDLNGRGPGHGACTPKKLPPDIPVRVIIRSMGHEVVYCARCQVRIVGREFESGVAFRAGNHFYCKACYKELPPEERAKSPPAAAPRVDPPSTTRIKPVTSRKAAPPSRSPMVPWVVAGLLGGSVLLILVFALSPGKRPPDVSPPRKAAAPKPVTETDGLEREKEAARREIQQREADRRRKEEEAKAAEDLAKLDPEVRAACAEGKFDGALQILDRARARRTGAEWAARIDRRAEAVKEEARRAQQPPEKEIAEPPAQPPKQEPAREPPTGPLVVYRDALAKGWLDFSWQSNVDLKAPAPSPETGTCISYSPQQAWAGLYLRAPGTIDPADYPTLSFRARASRAGQKFMLGLYRTDASGKKLKDAVPMEKLGGNPPADEWKRYEIPVKLLGAEGCRIEAVVIQDTTGKAQPPLLIDDLEFLPRAAER